MNRVNPIKHSKPFVSALCAMSLLTPLMAGCSNPGSAGGAGSSAQAPAAQTQNYGTVPAPQNAPQQPKQGMSTGKKVALLGGAALLYYLYNKRKNSQAQAGQGGQGGRAATQTQYYRSKNGRIYHRDAKGNAVYVTPPTQGVQVDANIAEQYNRAYQQAQRTQNFEALDNLPVGNDNYSLDDFRNGGRGMSGNMGNMGNMGGNMNSTAPGPRRN